MQEEYLHYLFKHKFFPNTITTVKGNKVEVLERGLHNFNAGPDFLEGKIKYDDKIWAGHIEFHIKSSDWNKHGHQTDPNYDNVIVHFVYEYDQPIFINNFEIPTVELKSLINHSNYQHYLKFKSAKDWIPCAKQIHLVDEFHVFQQKEKALINRLIRKSNNILNDINRLKGNQQHAFWIALGKVFGGTVNSEAFGLLVEKIEPHHLAQLNYNQTEIEAYCFGLAGFLDQHLIGDDYFDKLKERFRYHSKLFGLNSINKNRFKFSRMRPGNFPTVRIAQFSALLSQNQFNYTEFNPSSLNKININLSEYWQIHYNFSKKSKTKNSGLTATFKSLIIINAYLPFLFAQGTIVNQIELKEKAIDSLQLIKPEQNSIIKQWRQLKIPISNAFDTQALIEQKKEFCSKSNCLKCKIGIQLLKPKKEL